MSPLGGRVGRVASVVVVVGLLVLLATTHTADAAATRLRHRIRRGNDHQDASYAAGDHAHLVEMEGRLRSMVDSTELIHGLQAQVSSVTQSMDKFLNAHASDASAQSLDHEQIGKILATLTSLQASQRELEERNARQIEQDHANLLQLIETQKKQQAMLTQELQHSKTLETELAELKQQQEAQVNQHMAAQELEQSANLEHEIGQHQQQMYEDVSGDGSFIEMATTQAAASPWNPYSHLEVGAHAGHGAHAEHDIDLAHTMDHSSLSDLEHQEMMEAQHEEALGHAAAASSNANAHMDPSRYGSSADYLAAMNSAEEAEDMTPQQLQQLGQNFGVHADREVGTPAASHGLHSMSEIDSLVAEGEQEHAKPEFEFHMSQLKSSTLKNDLSMLQDEDSIQQAMLHAQQRIKAIAAELEKHQIANGEHPDGIEIDMEIGSDEPRPF